MIGSTKFLWLDAAQWTAIGTVALVLVTGVYVALTRQMASSAKASASASQRSAEASLEGSRSATRAADAAERAILLDVMPVLIGTSDGHAGHRLRLLVTNHGRGVAVGTRLSFDVPGEAISDEVEVGVLAPGSPRELQHEVSGGRAHRVSDGAIVLTYLDLIGNKYRASARADGTNVRVEREIDGAWCAVAHAPA